MYEMSRVARLKPEELVLVDDDFIHTLFRIIEGISDDVYDPYHYPTIRVLVSSWVLENSLVSDANLNSLL